MNINVISTFIIILIYFIAKLFIKENEKKCNNIFLLASFIYLFIILYKRKSYSDLINYEIIYDAFYNYGLHAIKMSNVEFIYCMLNFLVSRVSNNFLLFRTMIDFFSLVGPFYIIKRYSKSPLLSVLLYMQIGTFYMNFYILRQALAISILLYSTKYIEEKKNAPFLILILIAFLIHKSSLIYIIVLILEKINIKNKYYFYFLCIFLTLIVGPQISNLLIKSTNYGHYLNTLYNSSLMSYGWISMLSLLFIFNIFFKNKFESTISNNSMFICILFQILTISSSLFWRLSNYFVNGFIIEIPNTIINYKSKYRIIFIIGILGLIVYLSFRATGIPSEMYK